MSEAASTAMEAGQERVRAWAEGLADALVAAGLDVRASVAFEEPDNLTIRFEGSEAHYLVGRHGQALDALQLLASLSINARRRAGGGERLHILCDADNYRARRAETLRSLALELAAEVKTTGQEAVLDPLPPLERRIIHTALVDDPDVRTYSEGEDPRRYIIISPQI